MKSAIVTLALAMFMLAASTIYVDARERVRVSLTCKGQATIATVAPDAQYVRAYNIELRCK